MSMPLQSGPPADTTPPPAPAATPSAEPAAPGVAPEAATPPAAEPPAVHPAWERTFEEAGIPDMLRPKLIEQVRRSETEAQRAIEAARAEAVPAEWKAFIEQSAGANASPTELIQAWNATQQMINDPFTFLDNFQKGIDEAVAAGQITAPEGRTLKAQAADALGDPAALETDEQKQIRELTEWRTQQEAATAQAQLDQQATQYANDFWNALDSTLATAKYTNLTDEQKQSVADWADTALFNDPTQTLTIQKAMDAAVARLATFGIQPVPDAAPAPNQLPVQGGGNALPGVPPQKFTTEAERKKAMLDGAASLFGSGQ